MKIRKSTHIDLSRSWLREIVTNRFKNTWIPISSNLLQKQIKRLNFEQQPHSIHYSITLQDGSILHDHVMTAVMRWTWLKLRVVTDLSENIMVTISCVHGSATFSQLHYSRTPRASINIDARPSNPFLQRVCRGVNWQTLLRHPRKILRDQLLPGLNRWTIIISRCIFRLSDYLYCFETLLVTDLCIFVHFLCLEIYNRYLILVFQIIDKNVFPTLRLYLYFY